MRFHGRERGCGSREFARGFGRGFGGGFGRGFGEGFPGGGFSGDGGGRRRQFDGGELRLLLLALIAEGPRHGYDLIRAIEERAGGGYAPSPGVVYPTLTLLDEMALIEEVKEEGSRKRFAITEAGRAHLEEHKGTVEAILERLGAIGAHEKRGHAAPIRRAMMGLGMALRGALANGGDNPDLPHDIAAILDEAARKIERLER